MNRKIEQSSMAAAGASYRTCFAVLALLLAFAPTNQALRRLQQSSATGGRRIEQPDYNVYHKKSVLLDKVAQIVASNPATMKLETQKAQNGTYAANLQIITVELAGHSNRHFEKARLLVDFGEHGREFVSSELGLLFLQTLANRTAIETVFGNNPERGKKLIRLLEASVLKILPMENEAGRNLVESGKLCERKNGRGVDPNRNWPIDWGVKEKDYDPNEEYPGTSPFSEPEVQMLHGLASQFRPHVWLNVHSGMEAMFTPYDHKAFVPEAAAPAMALLKQIQTDIMKGTGCVIGSGGKTVGYLAHGTATDYMFEVLKVPMPYTWEIYGDFAADFHDCFRMFNPLTAKHLQEVLARWLSAIFRLVELMPTHPGMTAVEAVQAAHLGLTAANKAASTLAPTPARGGTPTLTPTTARTSANTNTQPNSSGSSASAHGASGSGSDSSSALEQEGGASSAWPVTALQYWRERQTALFVGLAGLLLLCGLLYRYLKKPDSGLPTAPVWKAAV